MVKLALQIKAIGENVSSIMKNEEDFRWHVKLKTKNSETNNFVYICQENEVEKSGSRGTVNHCQKIDGAEVSVSILPDKVNAYELPDEEGEKKVEPFQTVVAFECRGGEVSDFMFSDGWTVKGADGGTYEDVDLNEDWYDVDAEGQPMSLTELEFRIVKIK